MGTDGKLSPKIEICSLENRGKLIEVWLQWVQKQHTVAVARYGRIGFWDMTLLLASGTQT